MRLPDTCDLSPLRQVYVVGQSGTDGKRNLRPYMKVLHYDGSPFIVAVVGVKEAYPVGRHP